MKPWMDALGFEDDELHVRGLCSFGGGGGSTNTIQKSDPWAGQQPSLMDIYSQAANNYNVEQAGGNMQYYPNATYAELQPQQYNAINQITTQGGGSPALQAAGNYAQSVFDPSYTNGTQGAFNQGQGVLANELSSSYLNPMNNPGQQSLINTTLAKVVPQLSASFTSGNRSDSGLANRAISEGATDAIGNLMQSQYNTNVGVQNQAQQQAANQYLTQQGNQLKGLALAPGIDQASLSDLNAQLQAAGMYQQNDQNQINADMQRYNYGQMLPWNALSTYENAVTGTGSPGGTTSTQQPYFSNTGANIMGGISSAATLASLASAGAQAAGYSGLLMGAAPLLSFSDERLKEDIHKIGESDSGFPLYTFRYKGEPASAFHVGLLAQDVQKERPYSVFDTPSGYKAVDYASALAV